jgi:hypothetical protein
MKFTQKIQNMKCKMAIVGLGATLFFANACYAQQETNPDIFDANPGGGTEIGVFAPSANDGASAAASQPAQVASTKDGGLAPATQELASSQFGLLDSGISIAIAACLTMFGVYALLLASLKKYKKNSAATSNRSRLQRTTPRPAI